MIISQSRGKVKNKVLSLVKGLKLKLSLPLLKFVSEMVIKKNGSGKNGAYLRLNSKHEIVKYEIRNKFK